MRSAILPMGLAAIFGLAACTEGDQLITKTEADLRASETVAPAEPAPVAGPVEAANSLNGVFNLQASRCGDAASEGHLEISGTKFNFHGSSCTATGSNSEASFTEVSLACSDENREWSRQVQLRMSPGRLQLTEDRVTLGYYRCTAP
ncbi:MAG: hypothetical protein Q4F71_08630 [Paracoccus sp. (in: a-proteobacteria)]|nr:hypothetical protein [Paracoccus sp. (in: a-proteobacteria)]